MNSTIYIRKENEHRWLGISDKSAWVNAMLEEAAPTAKIMAEGNEAPYPATDLFRKESVGKTDLVPNGAKIAHLNKIRVENEYNKIENGVCKIHGLPLDSRGHCLQKGCKYA